VLPRVSLSFFSSFPFLFLFTPSLFLLEGAARCWGFRDDEITEATLLIRDTETTRFQKSLHANDCSDKSMPGASIAIYRESDADGIAYFWSLLMTVDTGTRENSDRKKAVQRHARSRARGKVPIEAAGRNGGQRQRLDAAGNRLDVESR
jgi:hypothetical protein